MIALLFLYLKIDGKGNCFFEALLIQLSFNDDPEGVENYKQYHIRRQMVAHMLKLLDLFKDWLRTRIREFYGTGDGDMGPFSVQSYLEWMLQDKVWGNMVCCYFVASMWSCRLSILNGDTCKETRSRHDLPLREAHFCCLFNSDVYNGHYSAICRDDQLLLITEKVTPKEGYRKELDVKWERRMQAKEIGFRIEGSGIGSSSSSQMVIVSGEMFEGLLNDREFADKVRIFVEPHTGRGTGVVQGGGKFKSN